MKSKIMKADLLMYPHAPPSCFITATEELNTDSGIKIYPNAFNSSIIVEDNLFKLTSFAIYDNFGKMIKQGTANSKTTLIELPNLSPGFYYIMLEKKKGQKISKKLLNQ